MRSYNSFAILILCVESFWMVLSLEHGYFWHISDTHVDQNYSRTGNPQDLCHAVEGKLFPDNGLYGNFLCDAPQYLVNVTVTSMKNIHPNPDFIIWTGDNLPHTEDYNPDWDITFEAIRNTTSLLTTVFPEVPIIPCIGNHDTFPPNMLPTDEVSTIIYKGYLEKGGWTEVLPKDTWFWFLKGGYFSRVVKPGLRIISLNTILWYTPNTFTSQSEDPEGQFEWLESVLKNCTKFSEKVYIIGHVAPGFYSRVKPGEKADSTFHPQHLQKYLDILQMYSKVIAGQMYGHYHLDMFTISQDKTGTFIGSSLLASSVSPWHSIDNDNASIPVNPSVRLIHFSHSDGTLLDYDQYYFNLTRANSIKEATEEQRKLITYEKLYTFTEFYGLPDASTESLVQAYEALKRNQTLFELFFTFLTAGKQSVDCDNSCKIAQLCAMSCTSSDEYDLCMRNISRPHSILYGFSESITHINSVYIYGSIILGLIIISLVVLILYRKFWKPRNRNQYQPFSHF